MKRAAGGVCMSVWLLGFLVVRCFKKEAFIFKSLSAGADVLCRCWPRTCFPSARAEQITSCTDRVICHPSTREYSTQLYGAVGGPYRTVSSSTINHLFVDANTMQFSRALHECRLWTRSREDCNPPRWIGGMFIVIVPPRNQPTAIPIPNDFSQSCLTGYR